MATTTTSERYCMEQRRIPNGRTRGMAGSVCVSMHISAHVLHALAMGARCAWILSSTYKFLPIFIFCDDNNNNKYSTLCYRMRWNLVPDGLIWSVYIFTACTLKTRARLQEFHRNKCWQRKSYVVAASVCVTDGTPSALLTRLMYGLNGFRARSVGAESMRYPLQRNEILSVVQAPHIRGTDAI